MAKSIEPKSFKSSPDGQDKIKQTVKTNTKILQDIQPNLYFSSHVPERICEQFNASLIKMDINES